MSFIKRRSRRAVAFTTVVVLALGGVAAFAYFSTSGSGTGEAKVSNPGETLEVSGGLVEGLAPGVSKEDKVTIKNTGENSVHVTTLTAKITGNSNSGAGCLSTWFKVSPETTTLGTEGKGVELAAGGTVSATPHVEMINTESSQNACKGATVNLSYLAQ